MTEGVRHEIVTKIVPPDFAEPYMPEDGQMITSLIRASMCISHIDDHDSETHMSMLAATAYIEASAIYHIAANSLKSELERDNRTMMKHAGETEVRRRCLILLEFTHKTVKDVVEEFMKVTEEQR